MDLLLLVQQFVMRSCSQRDWSMITYLDVLEEMKFEITGDMSINKEFLTTKRKENLKWHRENKFKK